MKPLWIVFLSLLFFSAQQSFGAIITSDKSGNQKTEFLIGEPIIISVSGLTPFSLVNLKLTSNNHQSENFYRALEDGKIDVSRQAPIRGTYNGIDPEGPLWSMLPLNSPTTTPSFDVKIEVLSDDEQLFEKDVIRKLSHLSAPSKSFSLTEAGFIGQLFLP